LPFAAQLYNHNSCSDIFAAPFSRLVRFCLCICSFLVEQVLHHTYGHSNDHVSTSASSRVSFSDAGFSNLSGLNLLSNSTLAHAQPAWQFCFFASQNDGLPRTSERIRLGLAYWMAFLGPQHWHFLVVVC
jgi:hypothetical protein